MVDKLYILVQLQFLMIIDRVYNYLVASLIRNKIDQSVGTCAILAVLIVDTAWKQQECAGTICRHGKNTE